MSLRPRRQGLSIGLVMSLVLAQSAPARAYLKLGIPLDGRTVELKWAQRPVRYYVTDAGVPGVSAGQFQGALGRAFATWEAVPSSSISYEFGGFTAGLPGDDDGWSTIGFLDQPDLDRVLASTSFLVDAVTGTLLESDIFFNSSFQWSASAAGQTNRFDLETIALHEIGHLSGLGHSALGETVEEESGRRVLATESVMFPIAFPAGTTANRSLRPDDIAGISDLYPDQEFNAKTGSISGRVTKNGSGLFGAHVVAFNPASGVLVGNFALTADGQFSIAGLVPGPYAIRVEPLDDGDIESFFDSALPPDLNFRVAFFNHLVVVPRGGDSGSLLIKVVAK
jgi:hypothetical protein